MRGAVGRWWRKPAVRKRIALVVVVIGTLLALFGVLTGRWGVLIAGIVVVGIGASLGPARIRP